MKKLIFYVCLTAVLSGFASCTFEDQEDRYEYSTVYFPYQDYNRNVIVGEGLKLRVGVTLTGFMENKQDRIVHLEVDPSLLDDVSGKTLLPSDYYQLGSTQIVIPKGHFGGYLPVKIDSVKFLADPKAVTGEYVLPIRIDDTKLPDGVDIVPKAKSFIRISLSYLAKQFGNYHYSGVVDKYMGVVLYKSIMYAHNPKNGSSYRYLKTVGPTKFRMVADPTNANDPMREVSFLIEIPFNGTEVTILPDPDSPFEVSANGSCTYDPATRIFHFDYKWTDDEGAVCYAVEDLKYRNRIYDDQGNGISINEWR